MVARPATATNTIDAESTARSTIRTVSVSVARARTLRSSPSSCEDPPIRLDELDHGRGLVITVDSGPLLSGRPITPSKGSHERERRSRQQPADRSQRAGQREEVEHIKRRVSHPEVLWQQRGS